MAIEVDLSPRPNSKELEAIRDRLERLDGYFGSSAKSAEEKLRRHFGDIEAQMDGAFRLRNGFSFRGAEPFGDYSDLKVPSRSQRPTATRLMASQGGKLRFYLMALAVAQIENKTGAKVKPSPYPIAGDGDEFGWTDVVAAGAANSRGGTRNYITAKDKRARSIRGYLSKLREDGLVALPNYTGKRGSSDGFILLREDTVPGGEADVYTVPRTKGTFTLPAAFIENSWIHVLEDSEITLLLMIACGIGRLAGEEMVAVPSEVRLLQYGIGRDTYSHARKTLEWFGLLDVQESVARDDEASTDENGDWYLHRFMLRPDGFDSNGIETVGRELRSRL